MLITFVGDAHLTGKNPIARLDDLTETQWDKWEEIVKFANDKNTPIISCGDLFHVSVVANSIVNRFGEILNELNNPLYCVFGNHDLLYHSLNLWKQTSLGVLLQNNPNIKHISEFKNDYGISWDYQDWDQEITNNKSKLLLSHKAVISKEQEQSNYWIANDISFADVVGSWSKQYEIILCGHWHIPYSFKYKDTRVINAGPVSRINVEDKVNPSICLINLKSGIFQRFPLKSAKPFTEVLSSKHLANKENNSENVKKFIEAISKQSGKYSSTFMEELNRLLLDDDLDNELKELLINILAKVEERKNK